jgi:hypothetical protein
MEEHMRPLRQTCAVTALSLLLAVSAVAGQIGSGGVVAPPPPPSETSTTTTTPTDLTTTVILTVLNLLS